VNDTPRKLVLVVDDDSSLRVLVTKALEANGYAVTQASDGLAASELLGQATPLPDLLICDIMMPTIDGFSLARLIKGRAELRGIPIIFLTARAAAEDVVHGIKLGAKHYLQKPFKLKELIDKVDKLLR
jgi:DNA-binding response OmpR family regulator